jgi:dihydroorotase
MSASFDLILKNGTVVTPWGTQKCDVAVRGGKIADLGSFDKGREIIDCENLHILPGVIDTQVHFREPGLTHKEDLATGTMGAIMGGVTSRFEMPNTDPLTIDSATFADKMARAKNRAFCDYAFFIGGCAENAHLIGQLEKAAGCCGTKIFMGSSTGALLAAQDEVIENILRHGHRRVALHAEDEDRLKMRKSIAEDGNNVHNHPIWRDAETALKAVTRAVNIARKTGRKIHLLHVTSGDEMMYLRSHKDIATVETTPQHLTLFAPDCYDRLGTRAQMNPPIRDKSHQEKLWWAVNNGVVDVLGSDHAPHTLEEKAKPYPASPSGMTGVQTMLPIMLDHMNAGRLSLERVVDLLSHAPQRVYQIAGKGRIAVGYDADFAIVDLKRSETITNRWIQSRCGWTPFDGMKVQGWVVGTLLRGQVAQWEGEAGESPLGQPVNFIETLGQESERSENLTAATIPQPRIDCC